MQQLVGARSTRLQAGPLLPLRLMQAVAGDPPQPKQEGVSPPPRSKQAHEGAPPPPPPPPRVMQALQRARLLECLMQAAAGAPPQPKQEGVPPPPRSKQAYEGAPPPPPPRLMQALQRARLLECLMQAAAGDWPLRQVGVRPPRRLRQLSAVELHNRVRRQGRGDECGVTGGTYHTTNVVRERAK